MQRFYGNYYRIFPIEFLTVSCRVFKTLLTVRAVLSSMFGESTAAAADENALFATDKALVCSVSVPAALQRTGRQSAMPVMRDESFCIKLMLVSCIQNASATVLDPLCV